jgi:hypothetical protein
MPSAGWPPAPLRVCDNYNGAARVRAAFSKQETKMKNRMYAELLFDNPEARDRAIVELNKLGLVVELLDWVDEHEGVVLSPTVWIKVRGLSELNQDEFFDEMAHLADRFNGDVYEAGLQNPAT